MSDHASSQVQKAASDLMSVKPFVAHTSMNILEIANLFLEHGYTSVPVIGTSGEILGIVDEFSLIKAKLVQHIEEQGRDKLAHHTEYLLPAHCIREETPLTEVVKEMIKAPNHRLLVVNKAKSLVGIISPKDILRYVVGVKKQPSVDLRKELAATKDSLLRVQNELEKTKGRLEIYKDIVMDNPSMIHSVDGHGKILMANRKMHQILGYEANELIGKTMFDLYAASVHHEALSGLSTIKETGTHQNTFTTMLKKNGEKIRIDIASTALMDEDGHFVGTISVSRPVDSDILLRALHGVLQKDLDNGSRYGVLHELESEVAMPSEKKVASKK
jgi:PAS domain S-box-containing protein